MYYPALNCFGRLICGVDYAEVTLPIETMGLGWFRQPIYCVSENSGPRLHTTPRRAVATRNSRNKTQFREEVSNKMTTLTRSETMILIE